MKFNFPYKENDIVMIYKNWELQKDPLGTARLVQHKNKGRTFILEDTSPEDKQVVYNYEEWFIEPLETSVEEVFEGHSNTLLPGVYKIRYIDTIGIANSSDDEDWELEFSKLPVDSFLTINGIEIY